MTALTNCEGWPGVGSARDALRSGRPALDAIEAGIRLTEAEPTVKSVGRGGLPDMLGVVTCDAAIMNGRTREAGAVATLEGYLHAVSVARAVMEKLPHVFLVGEGADRFAAEIDAEKAEMLTDKSAERYRHWLNNTVTGEARAAWPNQPLVPMAWESARDIVKADTVIFLAQDRAGDICAGTSTSGWAYRYPGRIGDSPIIGAGLYADNRYGACGCTHIGEMAIRAGTARAVVLCMKKGATVREACLEAICDLGDLAGGFLGPLVIHAIDRQGESCVVATKELGRNSEYYVWRDGMAEPEKRQAEVVLPG
jgi:L-asparaginase / beta-aspartyl-peptidase